MLKMTSAGAAILSAFAILAVVVGSAGAAAPAAGPVSFYAHAGAGTSQKVVFVGAIGDYGRAINVNKKGKVDPNGNYVKLRLHKGTFEIDGTVLNQAIIANQQPQVGSHETCSAAFSTTAPVTFFNGTGLYKGISGTANVTVTFGGVSPRYTKGPHKGECLQNNLNQAANFGVVLGQGTVSFAS
jgi:hypothetical protein